MPEPDARVSPCWHEISRILSEAESGLVATEVSCSARGKGDGSVSGIPEPNRRYVPLPMRLRRGVRLANALFALELESAVAKWMCELTEEGFTSGRFSLNHERMSSRVNGSRSSAAHCCSAAQIVIQSLPRLL